MNYISEGTCFFIALDVEQGILRSSTIDFIKEIQQYNLSAFVVITKTDKKPENEVNQVKELVEKQVSTLLKGAKVGITSSVDKNFSDVFNALDGIDVDEITKQKYELAVIQFIDMLIEDAQNEFRLVAVDKSQLENKKAKIQEKYKKAIDELNTKKDKLQSVADSANDVLNDIREVLEKKSRHFATILFNSKNDENVFSAELLSTVRPIIIHSLGREQAESVKVLEEISFNFSENIKDTLQEGVQMISNLATPLLKSEANSFIENQISKNNGKLFGFKAEGKAGLIGMVVTTLISYLPSILSFIFGGSDEKKIDKIEQAFKTGTIDTIIAHLRPEIENVVRERQQAVVQAVENEINAQSEKVDQQIAELEKQQQLTEIEAQSKRSQIEAVISELSVIKTRI